MLRERRKRKHRLLLCVNTVAHKSIFGDVARTGVHVRTRSTTSSIKEAIRRGVPQPRRLLVLEDCYYAMIV